MPMPGNKNVRQTVTTTALISSPLLRRAEAAKHIREKWGYPCSPRTLAKYAVVGDGPLFRKAGRYPLYHPDDLDNWIKDKLSDPVMSTSAIATDRNSKQIKKASKRVVTATVTLGGDVI
jgi:hypothetical protein